MEYLMENVLKKALSTLYGRNDSFLNTKMNQLVESILQISIRFVHNYLGGTKALMFASEACI